MKMIQVYYFVYRFGPLICHWTMHFEAKNKYIKGLAVHMGNFINTPYTLAVRHQQLQCYYNLNQEVIGKEWECGPSDTVSTDVLSGLSFEMSLASEPYRYVQLIMLFTVFFTLVALFAV